MWPNNILIAGLGLIGGSVALAIKKDHPNTTISGFDVKRSSLEEGKRIGIIDEIVSDLRKGAENADVIFLCAPVRASERMMVEIAGYDLKDNVIVTDVGSTKSEMMDVAQVLRDKGVVFVGGHPMAGSHKSGVSAANVDLFENAYYIFTPDKGSGQDTVDVLKALLSGTRAKFVTLTAKEHDRITGTLSHMPHIIASGLVRQAGELAKEFPNSSQLATGGFRDITRIASSDPQMWFDVLMSNRDILIDQLEDWQQLLSDIKEWISNEDESSILNYFGYGKSFRDSLPAGKVEGTIPAFYDLFVDIPDHPGAIAEVTAYLAEEGISLVNLKILETREDINGILQLSFRNERDKERAKDRIRKDSSYIFHEK